MAISVGTGISISDSYLPGVGITPDPGGPAWILATGSWNDNGVWDDTAMWKDA